MILYVAAIALLALQGMKLRKRSFNEAYLSKEGTNAVRGIFILLIFASHFAQYVDPFTAPLDTLYWQVRVALGQAVVTCFFFYSGYGVALSARQKGDGYVRAMPCKRIFPTLLVYDCSQLLFLILQLWRGRTYTAKDFILSFLAWNSFGNDNWYIFAILGLYVITWLVLRGRELNTATVGRVTVASLAFLLFLLCAGQGAHWYNTFLCYPLGMWFFLYKDKIDRVMSQNRVYWPVLAVTALAYAVAHKLWRCSVAHYVVTMLLFVLCVVFLTMKAQLRSPVLIYCGKHLQGLFLVHRIPFILLGDYLPWRSGPGVYLYFALGLTGAFLLEAAFSKTMAFLRRGTPVKV